MRPASGVTYDLNRWAAADDAAALDRAFPKLYAELRRLAEIRLKRRRRGGTEAPYDLLHEAYLRLSTAEPKGFVGGSEFLRWPLW